MSRRPAGEREGPPDSPAQPPGSSRTPTFLLGLQAGCLHSASPLWEPRAHFSDEKTESWGKTLDRGHMFYQAPRGICISGSAQSPICTVTATPGLLAQTNGSGCFHPRSWPGVFWLRGQVALSGSPDTPTPQPATRDGRDSRRTGSSPARMSGEAGSATGMRASGWGGHS